MYVYAYTREKTLAPEKSEKSVTILSEDAVTTSVTIPITIPMMKTNHNDPR